MNIPKFLDILLNRRIFFSRLFHLQKSDPLEGCIYTANTIRMYNTLIEDEVVRESFLNQRSDITDHDGFLKMLRHVVKHRRSIESFIAKTNCVSCWCSSEFESAGLWQIYAPETGGLAIRSTFSSLCSSFHVEENNIYIGLVKYKDYNTDFINQGNLFNAVYSKRSSYSHECEIRAAVFTKLEDGPGIYFNVDPEALIQSVYVAPFSPDWIKDVVEESIQRLGYQFPVVRSSISDPMIA